MNALTNYGFAQLVYKMREKQNEYFRTKSSIALNESKKLEKDVDEQLRNIGIPSRTSTQPKLF